MASTTATPTAPVQCLGPPRTPKRSRDLGGTSTRCRIARLTRVLCSHGSCGPASPHLPPRQRTEPPESPLHSPSPEPHESCSLEPIIACVSTEQHLGPGSLGGNQAGRIKRKGLG